MLCLLCSVNRQKTIQVPTIKRCPSKFQDYLESWTSVSAKQMKNPLESLIRPGLAIFDQHPLLLAHVSSLTVPGYRHSLTTILSSILKRDQRLDVAPTRCQVTLPHAVSIAASSTPWRLQARRQTHICSSHQWQTERPKPLSFLGWATIS